MVRRLIFVVLLNFCHGDEYNRPFYSRELEIYPTSGRGYEVEEPGEEYQNVRLMDYPMNRYRKNAGLGDSRLNGFIVEDQYQDQYNNGGAQRNDHSYQSDLGRYNEGIDKFPQRFQEHLPKYNQELSYYAKSGFPSRSSSNNILGTENRLNYNRFGSLNVKNDLGGGIASRLSNNIESNTQVNANQYGHLNSPMKSRHYLDNVDYVPDQRSISYEFPKVRYPFNNEINGYESAPIQQSANKEFDGTGRYYTRHLNNFHGVDSPAYHHAPSGKFIDQRFYNDENENVKDEKYSQINGKKSTESLGTENGSLQNKFSSLNHKGDKEYYNIENGGKKIVEDGSMHNGKVQKYKQGQNENQNKKQSTRRNGHVVKSFKTSHHKDESDKTEEYYDEAHNEDGQLSRSANTGNFGENSKSSYNGLKENKEFSENVAKKQGHNTSQESAEKNAEGKNNYSSNKLYGARKVYGGNYGNDNQSLLGHQEAKRILEQRPHTVPFF